jgi:cardiolipin synthase A/B
LNITSWLGNCELDAIIEDEGVASEMEQMFVEDLARATEIVLDYRRRPRPTDGQKTPWRRRSPRGSARRAAAGALRIGNVVSAAVGDRRVLGPVEAKIMSLSGLLLLALAVLFWMYPKALAYPLVALLLWLAVSLMVRGAQLFFEKRRKASTDDSS